MGEHRDVQFDAGTVLASSSSMMEKEKLWVGSKESMCAETKFLNLFAISISAPNRQEIFGLHNDWCANFTPFARVRTE